MISLLLKNSVPRSGQQNASQRRSHRRFLKGCAALGFASALSAPAFGSMRKAMRRKPFTKQKRFLSPFMADALIGAIGEVGALAILYPMDTIKVRCQAQGTSAGVILARLQSQGWSRNTLSSLFAGCGPSAVCAAMIGACYLASFSLAKRVLGTWPNRRKPIPLSSISNSQRDDQSMEAESRFRPEEESTSGSPAIDTAAALTASLLTSVIEAPVELFRHRMQAGMLKGPMLSNMASAYGVEGLASLYWNFLPFLLKGIPYDVAELFSYSQLTEHQMRIPALKHCPEAFRDCAIGALAGTAAVVFSMPADCIKVHMELSAARPPAGIHNTAFAFFKAGRLILAESGFQGLFRGLKPRLLETVPSSMFYWLLVATLKRTLEPMILKEYKIDSICDVGLETQIALP